MVGRNGWAGVFFAYVASGGLAVMKPGKYGPVCAHVLKVGQGGIENPKLVCAGKRGACSSSLGRGAALSVSARHFRSLSLKTCKERMEPGSSIMAVGGYLDAPLVYEGLA